MSVKTRAQLTTDATTVSSETTAKANTKTRIGALFQDIIDSVSSMLGYQQWGTTISPTALSGDSTGYNPTGWATAATVRVTSDATVRTITGFAAGVDGEIKTIINDNASTNMLVICTSGDFPILLRPGRGLTMQCKTGTTWNAVSAPPQAHFEAEWYASAAPATTSTRYASSTYGVVGSTTGVHAFCAGEDCILRWASFSIAGTALASDTVACTVQLAGSDSNITFTVPAGTAAGIGVKDSAHYAYCPAGTMVQMKLVQSSTTAQASWQGHFKVGT